MGERGSKEGSFVVQTAEAIKVIHQSLEPSVDSELLLEHIPLMELSEDVSIRQFFALTRFSGVDELSRYRSL